MIVGGPGWTRKLGATGLDVTAVTLGAGPLGSMAWVSGHDTPEDVGIAVVAEVLGSPIRAVDTSNGYSDGDSERRIGAALAQAGGVPDDFLVITKVDARGADYSGERVRASVRESKERLGLDGLPLVHLHDPEFHDQDVLMAPGGAVETLVRLRDEGEIGHLGVAAGNLRVINRHLDLGVYEAVLIHSRWSLVDRSAGDTFDRARADGLGIFNAAVYGGRLLADPHGGVSTYGYRPAEPETLAAVAAMAAACERHGTDLATAALQFSLRDPRVDTTVVGISRPERIGPLLQSAGTTLPDELWDELESLTPGPEHWLDHA